MANDAEHRSATDRAGGRLITPDDIGEAMQWLRDRQSQTRVTTLEKRRLRWHLGFMLYFVLFCSLIDIGMGHAQEMAIAIATLAVLHFAAREYRYVVRLAKRAAVNVLRSNMAIVSGPMPPGLCVMAEAMVCRPAKSTVAN